MVGPRPFDARAARAELVALFSPNVVVCMQNDEPDAPRSPDCHDACPLCRLAADVAALDPPAPPVFAIPIFNVVDEVAAILSARFDPDDRALHPLPRGPPSKT